MYLIHHGIKGMHWGVRRYQNPDGSLTSEGRKRYSVDVESAQQKLNTAKSNLASISAYSGPDYANALLDQKYAKVDLKAEKTKEKINKQGGLTKTQLKYQKEYMSKGMTEEEAAVQAYRKDLTKKALMIGAGVAITAVGAYAGYKYGQFACDSTIKQGTLFSRIAQNDNAGVHDAFYAVLNKNKTDKSRYAGIYGSQLKERGAQVYEKSIKATSDIKIASPKNAAKVMSKSLDDLGMRDDPSKLATLKDELINQSKNDRLLGATSRADLFSKAVNELNTYEKTGQVGKNLHDALNVQLGNNQTPFAKQFYKNLKDAGYSGVKDMNDSKYSGFMTKLPVIIADSSKVKVSDVRKLDSVEINNAKDFATNANINKLAMKELGKVAAEYGVIGGGAIYAKNKIESTRNDRLVKQYKDEHPNTKKSYNEIVRMYERQKVSE